MASSYKLLIHSASQVVQIVSDNTSVLAGERMKNIAILEKDGDRGLSVLVDMEGKIAAIGYDDEIKEKYKASRIQAHIDASGQSIIPGLVDGHTHAVWVGDRVHEFEMKLAGATYMQVHEAGGGIHFTVDRVQAATEDELYTSFTQHAQRALQAGTTLLECKSGYGLNADTELKMLRVLDRAQKDPAIPLEISSTYCGAHAIPKGQSAAEATEDVLTRQLPALKEAMSAGEVTVDNVDVFCEKGVFELADSRRILEAGKALGLAINFHGEELHRLGSAEMGAEIGARAISHLEEVSPAGISAMAAAGTVAVVLPTTAYILRLPRPPVRDMLAAGVPVALGSDFNPNAHCLAMPLVMHLACVLLRMSMPEALAAATINAAASLGRGTTHGALAPSRVADMVLVDAPRWEHLVYQLGAHHHVISHVIKAGEVVHKRT